MLWLLSSRHFFITLYFVACFIYVLFLVCCFVSMFFLGGGGGGLCVFFFWGGLVVGPTNNNKRYPPKTRCSMVWGHLGGTFPPPKQTILQHPKSFFLSIFFLFSSLISHYLYASSSSSLSFVVLTPLSLVKATREDNNIRGDNRQEN